MSLTDFIMASYCCQRYAECLVTTFCSSRTVHRTPCHTCATVDLLCQETPNFLACLCTTSGLQTAQIWVLWITRSGLSCSIMSTTDKSLVWMNWNGGSSISGIRSIFGEAVDRWWGRLQACVHAKTGHFEYSLWTDNVDFVHIYYIQCDLFVTYLIMKSYQQRW